MSGKFHLEVADAIDWLRTLPDESVDMVTTDTAYESLEKHRKVGTTTRLKVSKASSNEWFPIFPNARFEDLFVELYRVLAKNSHLYFYCDQETMFVAKPIAEKIGFKFWKPLVWSKSQIGMGYHYRAKYELVLFFEKGKRKLNDLGIADVLPFPIVRNGYPTEKPVELNEVFVRQSTDRGQLVIDPFMGSASAGVAALRHGRDFMGCDIKETAVAACRARLSGRGDTDAGRNWLTDVKPPPPSVLDMPDPPPGPMLGGPPLPIVSEEALAAAKCFLPNGTEYALRYLAAELDGVMEEMIA